MNTEHSVEPAEGALKANLIPVSRTKRDNGRGKSWGQVGLWQLPEAGEFSSDRSLSDPVAVIAEFRCHPVAEMLREATDSSPTSLPLVGVDARLVEPRKLGRPRLSGDWSALYLGYVMSRATAIQPFYDQFAASPLWQVCGFKTRPSYSLIDQRFGELESYAEAFAAAAQALVRIAKAAEPRVGQVVAVDATGWQSPSALDHCCQDLEACRAAGGKPPPRLRSDAAHEVLEARWAEAELDEDAVPDLPFAGTRRIEGLYGAACDRRTAYRILEINKHLYRSLDLSSGYRTYDNRTKWYGGYLLAAVDALTGLPVAFEVFGADIQEWNGYPSLYERMVTALGDPPYIVSTDRGYSIKPFYEFNTRRGVAVVSPRRNTPNRSARIDWRTDSFDEHGIPRCQHCGGEGTQDGPGLGLTFTPKGDPVIRFKCLAPWQPECDRTQSIRCEQDWRMLLPLSRTTELYHAVRWAHSNKEHVFRHVRERYGVAGKDFAGQLRRPGVAPQKLRAMASLVLDWFRLNLRQGWIVPGQLAVTINEQRIRRLSGQQDRHTGQIIVPGRGTEGLGQLVEEREVALTNLPYGRSYELLQQRLEKARH